MNKIVVTTGYMGSGSSAMTDLLSEISSFNAPNKDFEYVFLHCPNGFFDLEAKLTTLNNANRSDEAIHEFVTMMKVLYSFPQSKYWIAGYKENISSNFLSYVDDFLMDIGTFEVNGTWYNQQKPNLAYDVKTFLWKVKRKLHCKNNRIPSNYKNMMLAFPSRDDYIVAAKKFLDKLYLDLGIESHNLIMDQLILPHNLHCIDDYFDERAYFYVVDRDPRDVFILNKYYWMQNPLPYPTDVKQFCKVYRSIRTMENKTDNERVFRIHFEDLIYNYDLFLKKLYSELHIEESSHINKGMMFNPSVSINNTQVFLKNRKYSEETKYIEEHLTEFLYRFPYEYIGKDEAF